MKYNHTTYAVLGALTTGCRTGYAIKQLIDQSLSHFWKISYGQVYPALKQLVANDLAVVKEVSEKGKPKRNEYQLTDKGKYVLKTWLEEPVEELPVEKNELLFKLFFARFLSAESIIHHLQDYREKLKTQYTTYQNIENMLQSEHSVDSDLTYWLVTLDYGKRVTEAAIGWAEVTLDTFLEE